MTWTTLNFTYGQKLTSTQMNQLYDNFAAMANGDSGAPEIKTEALEADIIDGSLIADDSIDTEHLVDQSVDITRLDCTAILPIPQMQGLTGGGPNSGWSVVGSSGWYAYIPSGTVYLRCSVLAYTNGTAGYRIFVNSSTGSEITFDVSSSSADWQAESVINLSSINSWATINLECYEDLYWEDIRWRWASS